MVGVVYYNRFINEFYCQSIVFFVMFYYFDLLFVLEQIGGWCNVDIVLVFVEFVVLCFSLFGD